MLDIPILSGPALLNASAVSLGENDPSYGVPTIGGYEDEPLDFGSELFS